MAGRASLRPLAGRDAFARVRPGVADDLGRVIRCVPYEQAGPAVLDAVAGLELKPDKTATTKAPWVCPADLEGDENGTFHNEGPRGDVVAHIRFRGAQPPFKAPGGGAGPGGWP